MRFLIVRLAALIVLSFTTLASIAAADIHALVVGIDEYDGADRLHGAVADSDDISQALKRLSPKSIVTLKNREASRARILAGLGDLHQRAKPGDIVIFTYAGHGGREPWKSPSGRVEKAETFILSGFNARAKKFDEKILDKEINAWLVRMAATQAKVVFVADSCHAGGMTRSIDALAGVPTVRSTAYALPDTLITSADMAGTRSTVCPTLIVLSGPASTVGISKTVIGI